MSHVLVVDDDEPTCKIMARLLRHVNHVGDCAFGGEQAIAYLKDHPSPDLILLDFMMPDMDGLAVLRWIRGNAATAHTPVVMLSAVSDERMQNYARQMGATDYWIKASFDYAKLPEKIEAVLSRTS